MKKLSYNNIGDIAISSLKTNYIRIENLSQYKIKVKQINPLNELQYLDYWRSIKHKCVEGMWGKESGGYRYCSGSLFFYSNFALIQDTDENKNTTYIKPLIRDLEWEIFYMFLEAEGFSGYHLDDIYTSDKLILKYDKNKLPETYREFQLFNSKGELKIYKDARTSVRELKDKPLGAPLFFNEAKNVSILGSRGGGKSYTVALGKMLWAIVVDGGRYYNTDNGKFYRYPGYKEKDLLEGLDRPLVEVMVGSGDTNKSSEFIAKIKASMNALATQKEFGVWGEPGDDDYAPNGLYKEMSGSLLPGNKKNAWRNEYKITVKGRELLEGSKSKVYHVSYSAQKAKGRGAQEGAGGRVLYSAIEESGLTENSIAVHNSNTSVVSRNGIQFGVQIDIGTSGNIEAIVQTKKKFMNPQDYNIVDFPDEWEGMGKRGRIGFFLPFYMTLNQFKDNNGNTNFIDAFDYVNGIRKQASDSDDPSVLREEKMNRPIVPSEMWVTNKGYYLPYDQAIQTEKRLLKDNLYIKQSNNVKLYFDAKFPKGIRYEIDHQADPFLEWPINTNRINSNGAIQIFHWPEDDPPRDKYFFTHDPYVSENIDEGGSLGTTHGWINPKYWDDLPETGPLVCSYISKPLGGLKQYYEEQEKILQFYGDPLRGLAYEANRGTECKNYYMRKGKADLLALRPYFEGSSIHGKRITEYGYIVGNKLSKINYLDNTYDFFMQDIYINEKKMKVIDTLGCIFTIRQIIQYDIDGNFDAVSSTMIAAKHIENMEQLDSFNRKDKRNRLIFFSQNEKVFKKQRVTRKVTTTNNDNNIWNLGNEVSR